MFMLYWLWNIFVYPYVFMISKCLYPLIRNYLFLASDPYCHLTLPTLTSHRHIRANTPKMGHQTSPQWQTLTLVAPTNYISRHPCPSVDPSHTDPGFGHWTFFGQWDIIKHGGNRALGSTCPLRTLTPGRHLPNSKVAQTRLLCDETR